MNKHTPGPWKVYDKTGKGAWNIMGATHGRVTYIDSSYANEEEIAANARLIAKAPELYSACKGAEERLTLAIREGGNPTRIMCAVELLRALLAEIDGA